jgi:hypothetical protein
MNAEHKPGETEARGLRRWCQSHGLELRIGLNPEKDLWGAGLYEPSGKSCVGLYGQEKPAGCCTDLWAASARAEAPTPSELTCLVRFLEVFGDIHIRAIERPDRSKLPVDFSKMARYAGPERLPGMEF